MSVRMQGARGSAGGLNVLDSCDRHVFCGLWCAPSRRARELESTGNVVGRRGGRSAGEEEGVSRGALFEVAMEVEIHGEEGVSKGFRVKERA